MENYLKIFSHLKVQLWIRSIKSNCQFLIRRQEEFQLENGFCFRRRYCQRFR